MKKNGFTLVELLAVIVILAIILAVSLPSISGIINNARLNSFNASSDMIERAAKAYLNANGLTVNSGATIEIPYIDIKNAGFINKAVDPMSNNECTYSKVFVTNIAGNYTYKGALICDNYMDIDVYNLVSNNDFSNGLSNWLSSGATVSVSNNILTATGDSAHVYAQQFQSIPQKAFLNHKYYIRSKVRVTNSNCISSGVMITNGTQYLTAASQVSPTQNQWYYLSGISTFTAGSGTTLSVYSGFANYADNATNNGAIMQVDAANGIYAFDLTAIYGAGNEPTVAQINNILSTMKK